MAKVVRLSEAQFKNIVREFSNPNDDANWKVGKTTHKDLKPSATPIPKNKVPSTKEIAENDFEIPKTKKKTVKLSESELIEMINKVVSEYKK